MNTTDNRLSFKLKTSVFTILKLLCSAILVIFAFNSFMWEVWWLFGMLTILSFLIWARRKLISISLFLIIIVSLPLSFNQISNKMDYLGDLIRNQGSQALSTWERVSIYSGNIAMAVGGFAILAPEVAVETLLLMDPRGKDRTFHSDFAMGSKHITDIIEKYTLKVKSGSAPLRSERIPLRWGAGQDAYSMFDHRVSWAVAGGGLFLDYQKSGDTYKIKCRITIAVKYSEGYKLKILNAYGIRLYIDEAIFSALQDLGWLQPYFAHYHWTLTENIFD